MNRLTKDLNTPHDDTTYADVVKDCVDRENVVLTKLKHYEDIEEGFEVDLEVLFKALTNGFFAKDVTMYHLTGELSENQKLDPKYLRLNMWYGCIEWENIWNPIDDLHEYYFKDYGKTWALTKEELEVE